MATSVFASGTGPLLEEYAPYQGAEGTKIYYDDEDFWYYSYEDDWSLNEEVRYWYSFELENTNILPDAAENNAEGVEAIKSELMRGRATTVAFKADTSMPGQEETSYYINLDTWAHYTYDNSDVSHMVSIVGWDDSYSRYMFDHNLTDENGNLIAEYFDDEGNLNEAGREVADWERIPDGDGAWIAKNSWGSLDSEAPNHY
ncbi:MAG: hypothetical protein LIO57_02705, partial [Oscillospiraceae bacterium]|nr:hypothetical protein [Oscillospiraceae bacterium]